MERAAVSRSRRLPMAILPGAILLLSSAMLVLGACEAGSGNGGGGATGGGIAVGEKCSSDSQCQSELRCAGPLGGTVCSDGKENSVCTYNYHCKAKPEEPEEPEEPELYCDNLPTMIDGDESSNMCERQKPDGVEYGGDCILPCMNAEDCAPCEQQRQRQPGGVECGRDWQCASGYCGSRRPLVVMVTSNDSVTAVPQPPYVCEPARPAGGACLINSNCQNNECTSGKCECMEGDEEKEGCRPTGQ